MTNHQAAEMVVPIPVLASGEYDWRVVQEVVYDIRRVHDDFNSRGMYPVDYAFEARLMAGSDIVMSAQYGEGIAFNKLNLIVFVSIGNTAPLAIEMASSNLVPLHIWDEFKVGLSYS